VETALLLRPKIPERETFDDERMGELVTSIQAVGILHPLIVRPEGKYFRVLAGDRRRAAALALGLAQVPVRIWPENGVPNFAITAHENTGGEDVNPIEEGRYFERLLEEECGGDIELLAQGVRKHEGYINSRLSLLKGDPLVVQALAEDAISMGAAEELQKITHPPYRRLCLEVTIKQGAGVRQVREWRVLYNNMAAEGALAVPDQPPMGVAALPPPTTSVRCLFCHRDDDQHEMEIIYVHRSCMKVQERQAAVPAV